MLKTKHKTEILGFVRDPRKIEGSELSKSVQDQALTTDAA